MISLPTAKKIEKEDGIVDWNNSAESICHQWQAYTPWPGIYTMYQGKRLLLEKISVSRHSDKGSIQGSENRDFWSGQEWRIQGAVMRLEDGSIAIVCGEWLLTLEQVKLEWKKSQSIGDFVNGNQGFIWVIL
jgi:methionyl-tRNA formyltransferase